MPEPSTPLLQVPMRETAAIALQDTLTIQFTEDCCFCCDISQVDNFKPGLPIGDQKAGYTWVGVAVKAGTINFHHDAYGKMQGESYVLGGGSRSIQVGS
jgi:hypothetical protein